jgi:hypothetical protein
MCCMQAVQGRLTQCCRTRPPTTTTDMLPTVLNRTTTQVHVQGIQGQTTRGRFKHCSESPAGGSTLLLGLWANSSQLLWKPSLCCDSVLLLKAMQSSNGIASRLNIPGKCCGRPGPKRQRCGSRDRTSCSNRPAYASRTA